MAYRHPSSRRHFLAAGMGAATAGLLAGAARAELQQGLASAARTVNPALVARASAALARHNTLIWSRDVIAIVDFGLPSSQPRLHLVDILANRTTSLLVAHGKGSDPDHTGMLQRFSNEVGSEATSEGAYLTGELYSGVHGLSRRLTGLDPTNDRAEERAIVIHSAWYADPSMVVTQGRLGRSDGCFAVSEHDIVFLLARLGEGRLLYAGRAQQ
jgi:hypothetical protein